jgi:molybdate transport system regulatory protein
MIAPRFSLRIDLPNGSRLGPGKIALLEAVQSRRSIAAAARDHGMSYRRAWLLLDELNRAFTQPVIETFPGRSQGAGAALTDFGVRLIAVYRAAERSAHKAARGALDEIGNACSREFAAEVTRSSRKSAARGA